MERLREAELEDLASQLEQEVRQGRAVPELLHGHSAAQHSQIRAEKQAAHTLCKAARDIVHTATGPDGSTLMTLPTALVWATIVTARWHEAKNYAR